MVNPVPGYSVTTAYLKRGPYWSCSEDAAGNGVHTGVDLAAPTGAKCVAARPGTVRHVNHGSSFGNHQIEVVAADGTADFYAHMRSRAAAGAKVDAGDKVGEVGTEGNVSGAHLHFEKHKAGHSGWSCSVHTDPWPSINYKAGGGGAQEDDDMPEYASAKMNAGSVKLPNNEWKGIEWDRDDGPFTKGSPGIAIGGRRYTAAFHVTVSNRGGKNIRTQTFEFADGEAQETNAQVTHDKDYAQDTRVGSVAKDRGLRFRVKCDGPGAVLESATAMIVYW